MFRDWHSHVASDCFCRAKMGRVGHPGADGDHGPRTARTGLERERMWLTLLEAVLLPSCWGLCPQMWATMEPLRWELDFALDAMRAASLLGHLARGRGERQ